MEVQVKLFMPLDEIVGQSRVQVILDDEGTLQGVIDVLVARFGPRMRRYLYDDQGRIVSAWSVFINNQLVSLDRRGSLAIPVADGDELTIVLNIAGG